MTLCKTFQQFCQLNPKYAHQLYFAIHWSIANIIFMMTPLNWIHDLPWWGMYFVGFSIQSMAAFYHYLWQLPFLTIVSKDKDMFSREFQRSDTKGKYIMVMVVLGLFCIASPLIEELIFRWFFCTFVSSERFVMYLSSYLFMWTHAAWGNHLHFLTPIAVIYHGVTGLFLWQRFVLFGLIDAMTCHLLLNLAHLTVGITAELLL